MKSFGPLVATCLAVAGCTSASSHPSPAPTAQDGLSRTRIGQTVAVGGPKVTPLVVIEDSRCPAKAVCFWAGQVRISARVDLGRGSENHELTQGKPIPVADGTLELVEVLPARPRADEGALSPKDYRFAFRFMGGL